MNQTKENALEPSDKESCSKEQLSALLTSIKSQKKTSLRGWRYFFAAFILGISIALIVIHSYQFSDPTSVSFLFDYLLALLALIYILYLVIGKNWKENNGLFVVSKKTVESNTAEPEALKSSSMGASQNTAQSFSFYEAPKEEIFEKSISESRSFSVRVKDLQSVLADAGFSLSLSVCQDILCGISCSHLFVITGVEETKQPLFYEALCRYFGCPKYFQKYEDVSSSKEALFVESQEGGFLKATPFLSGFAQAAKNQNRVSLLGLKAVQPLGLNDYLMPLQAYFAFPLREDVLSLSSKKIRADDGGVWDSQILLPSNVFVAIFLGVKKTAWDLPFDVLKNAFSIDCSCSTSEASSRSKEPFVFAPTLSFFSSARFECEKNSFVEESDWKKLDAIEQMIWKKNPFGNPEENQMDDFTSIKIALGASSLLSLDSLLAEKILPCAFASYGASLFEGEAPIDVALDKQFGEGCLPLATPYCEKARTLLKLRAEKKEKVETNSTDGDKK